AIGVIVVNNVPGGRLVTMAGTDPTITIPSLFISYEHGLIIKQAMQQEPVNVTLKGSIDFQPGDYPVLFQAVNTCGQLIEKTVTLSITDTTPPTAVCQNITVYLDETGNATITASDLDGGSTDNCGTVNFSASQTAFTCADIGSNNLTLTVSDGNGNESECVSVVMVADTITPLVGSISGATDIDYGSSTGDLTLSGNYGPVQKWQKRFGTSGTWTDIVHTDLIYSETPAALGTWQYRALVQSGVCSEGFTEPHSVTVGAKELTIGGTFTANDKIYDDNTDATFDANNLELVGVVGTEDVSLTGLEIDFASKEVGNHTVFITAALLTGADMGNYTLSLDGAPETTANINPGAPVKFFVTETDGSDIISPKLQNIPFDAKVTLVDAFDNPTPNTGGDATITLTGSGGDVAGNLSFLGSVGDPVELTLPSGDSSIEFDDILYSGLSALAGFDVMISASATGGSAAGNTGQSAMFSVRGIFLSVTAGDPALPADGTSETLITVLLTDAQEPPQALAGQQITLSTDFGTLFDISDPGNPVAIVGSQVFTTGADGKVFVALQAAATSGVATVLALCPGACPAEAEVAFLLSAPAITGFTPGEEEVEVDFDAPANEGADAITNYEYSLDDGANWAAFAPEQASSPVIISGLTGGESYPLQLRAINGAGTGEASGSFEVYPCYNPTNAGEIGESQTIEFNTIPDELISVFAASGHFGALEYQWQQSTTSATTGFSDITGAENASYQPGVILQNTWFRRLARVSCMAAWDDAVSSNVVLITVIHTQTLEIPQGWSYISSYLNPDNSDIEILFQDIVALNNLSILAGINGIYAPAPFFINTMGNWDYTKGYKVKMHQADELFIVGDTLTDKSLAFSPGTHIIPVLTNHDVVLADVIENPQDKLNYMFDLSGNKVFWPAGGIYTLTELEPGKGYLANFSQAVTIEYPDMTNDGFKSKPFSEPAQGPWPIVRTGNVHLVSVSAEAFSNLENADYLGAFDGDGYCVGFVEISGASANVLLTIYGDDLMTEEANGLTEGETISLRTFKTYSNEETPLEAEWNQAFANADGLFATEGLSQIVSLKSSATAISKNHLAADVLVYPNPAKDVLNLVFDDSFDLINTRIELVNSTGSVVLKQDILQKQTNMEIQHIQPGIFVLKIFRNGNYTFRKVVVQ
ncbi:MAG: T9SS type A sorting domain-containing protein, partial [Bacteroidales bacterium]|nr:T9SS type A sorting domain-containing protein [Bacteroidales bacterium]